MNYEQAKQTIEQLRNASSDAGKVLQGFPRGAMGLTPDSVKSTPEYRAAKAEFDRAFAAERAFNAFMIKQFKAEMRTERRVSRAMRVNLSIY